MRTPVILIIAVSLVMPAALAAQTRNSQDSISLLTHSWTLTTMVFDGKTEVMPYGKMPLLDLKKDGTLLLPDPERPQKIHWSLLSATRYLVLDKPYKILKLDDKTLVLADVEDAGRMYLSRR